MHSCLTTLGIFQAHVLAKFLIKNNHIDKKATNIFCSSYMNRAQLTTIEIACEVNKWLKLDSPFNNFQMLMRKMSMARLYRILGKNLDEWKVNMKKLSTHFSSKNLPYTSEETYQQLIKL